MKHFTVLMTLLLVLILVGCIETPIVGVHLNDGDDLVTVGTSHVDTGCVYGTGTVVYDMDVTANTVDINALGEYSINYVFVYESITYTCTRIVKVIDDIAPTARLKPGVDTIYLGQVHIDSGIIANDNYDEDLLIEVTDNIDLMTPGTYEIIYVITDDSGNKTLITRIVTIIG